MEIYILRDNQEFGPYSREAALEYVKQGIFEAVDQACYAGMTEWKPVGELLGIDPDSKHGKGAARGSAGKIAEFNPTWVHSNATRRRRPRRGGIRSALMIVLNIVLIGILATAAYVRWGGGSGMARHWLAVASVELARLANEGSDNNATPAPAVAGPVIVKTPAASATSSAAPAAGSTPVLAASPVAASTPALAVAAPASPQPATTENVAASPAPVVAPAPSPGAAIAAESAPASVPDGAGSPIPGSAVAATPAPVASTPAPVPASPPGPPKPFDPADLAGNPASWPKTVHLKQAAIFRLVYNSQVVGSVNKPAGTLVKLVNMQGDQLILECGGLTQTVPWTQTDLAEEVAKSGSLAPPAPSAPGAPVAAPPSIAPAPPSVAPAGSVAGTPAGN